MITIKTKKDIEILCEGGKKLAIILEKLKNIVKPGITTGNLEKMACSMIKKIGGKPSFKGYSSGFNEDPFPTALCTSINDEIVHAPALPSRELKEGDIVGIDIGMIYPNCCKKKYYTDMAITVGVGRIKKEAEKLIKITKRSLELAIKQVKPGNTLKDIGKAVEEYSKNNGYSVVRELVGHGVGFEVHEEPQVPNYEVKDGSIKNIILKSGMVIAIEPMINIGNWKIKSCEDGFTFKTIDKSLSAHFEHTIAIVDNGSKILTIK